MPKINKPERVFGLQVRCRELDIFKILEISWIFGGNFLVGFFGGIFLGGMFWDIFWEDFFGSNSLGGIT